MVVGEYYYQENPDWGYGYVFKYGSYKSVLTTNVYLDSWGSNEYSHVLRIATPQERHWLDVCIAAGKFVSKHEAMESFDNSSNGKKEDTQKQNDEWWKQLKTGDCMVCVKDDSDHSRFHSGFIMEYDKMRGNFIFVTKTCDGINDGFHYINFRPAKPQETALYRAYGKPVHINTPMPQESASTSIKSSKDR